jgi:hypothetical protein
MEQDFFKDFNPEVGLNQDEASQLAALTAHPGFKTIQKIFRCGVDSFAVAMLNTDQATPELVLARHNAARTAAQFYTWVISRINHVKEDYINSIPSNKPIESVENLDLGDETTVEEIGTEESLF